jgi:hypothetical protein
VIAYVMPTGRPSSITQLAARGSSDNALRGLDSPIAELLAVIEAEQNRTEGSVRPAAPPRPTVPAAERRELPLVPFLADLFGIKDRPQAAPPRPAPPQRQQRVQQLSGRVAADAGLAKIFGTGNQR